MVDDDWEPPVIAVFDTETTGLDVEQDHIVTAFLGVLGPDGRVRSRMSWLVNPGVHIPHEAQLIHGITDDDALRGKLPTQAIREIVHCLEDLVDADYPVVAYNASYDLTLLHREAERHLGLGRHVEALYDEAQILDPLVIDKAIDPFRAGSRNLATTAAHYGIEIPETGLHAAETDAVLAGRLMLQLWRSPDVRGFPAGHLHERQISHARRQAGSFRDYLHSQTRHEEALAVRSTWPYHPVGAGR
jgi:DNA polymerase-3 subunit epsilon